MRFPLVIASYVVFSLLTPQTVLAADPALSIIVPRGVQRDADAARLRADQQRDAVALEEVDERLPLLARGVAVKDAVTQSLPAQAL